MTFLRVILYLLGALLVLVTAASLVRTRAWWARMFDFPRAQIALLSLALLGAIGLMHLLDDREVAVWEWILLGLLVGAVVVQAWMIVPYTRLWPKRVPDAPPQAPLERRVRLVVSNVLKENRDFDRWLQTVRAEDPDVIIAVEPDRAWDQALEALSEDYPHAVREPQDNTYGLIVYSRRPLRHTRIKHLLESDVPSIFTVLQLPCGQGVRLVVLHPRPPRPDIQQDSVLRDGELVRAARIICEFQRPVIVLGDLNDVAWSRSTRLFVRLARMMDPRIGRGRFSTYHADHRLLRYPLDHVFHSNHFDLVRLRRLGHVGSDHLPICIDLSLRPEGKEPPDVVERQEGDEDRAIDATQDVGELLQEESPKERRERKIADR